jgi:hypothetical protein
MSPTTDAIERQLSELKRMTTGELTFPRLTYHTLSESRRRGPLLV